MNVIKTLRGVVAEMDSSLYGANVRDDEWDVVDGILNELEPGCYEVDKVDSEFENGGRWTNTEIAVYKVEQDGEVAYFSVWQEVPATEMQEGGDFSFGIDEVEPREVTVIKYVAKAAV